MKKTIFIFASLLFLVMMGVNLYKTQPTQDSTEPTEEKSIIENKEAEITEDAVSLTGSLKDVSGGNSSGVAYLLRTDGELEHSVEADLPDLEQGLFYEGWLVNKASGPKFFSTGVMKKVEENYVLKFNADEASPGYNEVVITLETKIDAIPEEHILEGVVR